MQRFYSLITYKELRLLVNFNLEFVLEELSLIGELFLVKIQDFWYTISMEEYKKLEEKAKQFYTKKHNINGRVPLETRNQFISEVKIIAPWVLTLEDALYAISNQDGKGPVCKFCGNKAFYSKKIKSYRNYCINCKDKAIKEKREKTMIEKYGVANPGKLDNRAEANRKMSETKKKKYANGETTSWIKGLTKETDERVKLAAEKSSERWKKSYEAGNILIWNKGLTKETDERVQKYSNSLVESWVGREQSEAQKEVTKKFIEIGSNRFHTKEEQEKQKKTNLERYGVESYLSIAREKRFDTMEERYGSPYFCNSDKYVENKDIHWKKIKATNLKRYGFECAMQNEEVKNRVYQTKKENNTFKSSKAEKRSIKILQQKRFEVWYQYKSKEYPFACDAYLPRENLYIEFNYYWSHQNHEFNENNPEDLERLDYLKTKSKQRKLEMNSDHSSYDNTIEVWTLRDKKKFDIVRKNNLNFKAFYNEEDFLDFYDSLESENLVIDDRFTSDLEYKPINNLRRDFINFFKGSSFYTSRIKNNRLLLPFIWKEFYKGEIEAWKELELKTKLLKNRCMYLNKRIEDLTDNDILRGFNVSGLRRGFSSFSPKIITSFMNEFNIKSIYDPCGGWGHRLLGSWNIDYHYNDTNTELVNNIKSLDKYYSNIKQGGIHTFSNENASEYIPNRKFDATFTCPPYFDTEIYSSDKTSTNIYKDYSSWLNIWWRNTVINSKKVSNIFAYVISEKYALDMNRVIEEEGFTLIDIKIVSVNKKNHISVSAKENLFIYKLN